MWSTSSLLMPSASPSKLRSTLCRSAGKATAREVVEALLVLAAAAQELPHRALGRVARHDVLADRVERLGEVDGRGQRVGAAVVAPVAGAAGHQPYTVSPSPDSFETLRAR